MKISNLTKVIDRQVTAAKNGEPILNVYVKSAPGVGKSSSIHQVAAEHKIPVIDIRGAQLDPVDLRGLPYLTADQVTQFSEAGMLPRADRDGPIGVLFLDELAQSSLAVQNSMLQLVLDRKLGDYHLPNGWLMVAAGNRDIDRAGAGRVTTALGNRVVHIELDIDQDEWHGWGLRKGIRTEVLALIKRRPNLLSTFDPKAEINATPRSWEFVHTILEQGFELDIEAELIEGAVGKGPAAEFMGFRKIWKDLPNIQHILEGKKVKISDKPDIQYATVISLAVLITGDNLEHGLGWTQENLPAEFAAMLVKDLQTRMGRPEFTKTVARTKAFQKWAASSGQQIMAA
jgi:hypothetical protein